MTLQALFNQLTTAFQKFENPPLEARHLLTEALNLNLSQFVLGTETEISASDKQKIMEWAERRLNGVPLAYLSGRKYFYKYEFRVRPGVLVPRPETEFVVEAALNRARGAKRIVDFGSGSGCIGLTLLKEISSAHLVAVENSPTAVEVIGENARLLGLENRLELAQLRVEDWSTSEEFELVVANPPYIAAGDVRVQESVHRFEPHQALYAEDGGLGALRSWSAKAASVLGLGGVFVVEFGSGQSAAVQAILEDNGFADLRVQKDLAGIDRVISAIKKGKQHG